MNPKKSQDGGVRSINADEFPWSGSWQDKAFFLLKYGILAPSTHNSQPWLFKITEHKIDVYYNAKYKLPKADPKSRDLNISLGCCIENIHIAADYYKMPHNIMYHDQPSDDLRASIQFLDSELTHSPNEEFRPLLQSILQRKNARGLFDGGSIDKEVIENVLHPVEDGIEVNFVTDQDTLERIAEITLQGIEIAYNDPGFRREMSEWMHNNYSKTKEGIFGHTLRLSNVMSIFFPIAVRYLNIGKKVAALNGKSWQSSSGAIVISSSNENPEQWMKIGRLAEHFMLELPLRGLQTSIFAAGIESGDLQKEIKSAVKTKYSPQFLFCVGAMSDIQKGFSPRIPCEQKILS